MRQTVLGSIRLLLLAWLALLMQQALGADAVCDAVSGARLTPVLELYTSEGCSSCPPADQWLARLKGRDVIAQAFHVGYWDYIGWKDRFAQAVFSVRQRDLNARQHLNGVYTPQLVVDGLVSRDYPQTFGNRPLAQASISLKRVGTSDLFEARVVPLANAGTWTAYWTVTEDSHNSNVKSGENAGELLKHDFVVRQLESSAPVEGPQTLRFFALPSSADHLRRINLVVQNAHTGVPIQALSLPCPSSAPRAG